MKVFFDTEFTGLHQNTTLLSIGLVKENGDIFYAQFTDYDENQVDEWISNNILKNMLFSYSECYKNENLTLNVAYQYFVGNKQYIKERLLEWLEEDEIEFWSDCLSYDWVLLNELWGGALNIPKNLSYIPLDICTLLQIKNIDPDINREEFINHEIDFYAFPKDKDFKHNALWDALVIKKCYEKLIGI